MRNRLDLLDFLRGFAIFTIALMHLVQCELTGALNKAAAFGGAGVHVFILLSGFGLYLSHKKKPLGYGEFLLKRFLRVYWPYAIIVALWAVWLWCCAGFSGFAWRQVFSHLFLYKMFDSNLCVSLCYPFWFISAIMQFYICWPLILRLARVGSPQITWKGFTLSLTISMVWWILVGYLGFEDSRPWGSCFFQYLWEFVLGMWIAEWYTNDLSTRCLLENPKTMKIGWLLIGAVVGMGLTGVMAWNGGVMKLFNDVPSLLGYTSVLLLVYALSDRLRGWTKHFYIWASKFGYEFYLVHSLTYSMMGALLKDMLPLPIWIVVSFVMAYIVAWMYNWILKLSIYKK